MRAPWFIAALLLVAAPHAFAETLTVARQTVSDAKAVFATVESRNVEPARARIGGTVAALAVKQGDEVSQRQVVATVADEKLAAADQIARRADRGAGGAAHAGADGSRAVRKICSQEERFRKRDLMRRGPRSMWPAIRIAPNWLKSR